MAITAPPTVQPGQSFSVGVTFGRAKNKGQNFVGVYPPGYGVQFFCVEGCDPIYARMRSDAYSTAGVPGGGGTFTLSVPSTAPPGSTLPIAVFVQEDGGTQQVGSIMVAQPPASAPVPPAITPTPPATAPAPAPAPSIPPATLNPWAPPGAAVYTPPVPEPKASDGAMLSLQGADLQAYYVANAGPGVLAATQFVIDHEHQLSAIGASQHPTTTYTPPATEPSSSNGEKLSGQGPDVQTYYVQKYGPGFLAASAFVNDRNAALGTSIPGGQSTVLPAGPGAGGPSVGIIGGNAGGWGTGTPTVPDQRQTGQPPPSVGGLVAEITSNKPLLIGAAIAAFFYFGGGRRR